MSQGYKKEYIDKVKAKFNLNHDLQSSSKGSQRPTDKSRNDKDSKVCKSAGVVKLG
jgi:hypothetical protein